MSELRDPGRVIIIGCGPTGCGAATRLDELGHEDYTILDRAARPGGLASSAIDDTGFTWDMGGHVQFSHYDYYDNVLDEAVTDGWLWHQRESFVWIDGRFVPYPLQFNIHRLDPNDRDRILDGLRNVASTVGTLPPRNFAQWLERTYGRPLAEQFLFPYNEKVWGYPLEEMDWSWVGNRVAVADLDRIEQNVREQRDDTGWGSNRRFRFPKRGGTGAIWSAVASRLRSTPRLSCKVVSIDTKSRTVRLESGERLAYDTLISSVPLDVLTRMAHPLPEEACKAAERLRFSSVHIIGVGLARGRPKELDSKNWMYFPQENSPYYRVTVFSNYSPHHVPPGEEAWSLMAEVCESPHRPVDPAALEAWTLEAMRADKLIGEGARVLSFWHHRLAHGYPTPTLDRGEALDIVIPALESKRIFSRGRFGGWKYEVANQDHSFMQGVELVNRLVQGVPEVTFFDPERANSGEFLASR